MALGLLCLFLAWVWFAWMFSMAHNVERIWSTGLTKGQIKSEWIYETINFSGHFLEIDDFINSFWLILTFRIIFI